MPYRPEAELKRPDLKGEFLCGHCGKTFCHAASLNRHRLNFHGDDQQCLICNTQIAPNDTVRRHMQVNHAIPRVFTCGCCNWTFPDKKELHSHNNCMMKTGQPGEAKAIAISSRPPGSLSQHELRGEERTPTARSLKKKMSASPKSESSPTMINSIFTQGKPSSANNAFQSILGLLGSTQTPNMVMPGAHHPVDWISLFMNNPAFIPLIQQQQQLAAASLMKQEKVSKPSVEEFPVFETSPSSSNSERASTSLSGSSNFNNNNYGANQVEEEDEEAEVYIDVKTEPNDDDEHILVSKSFARDLLIVRTDPSESSTSSGPESGIGSAGDDVFTPSPCSMTMRSKEGSPSGSIDERDPSSSSPLDVVNLLASPGNRKRKSVDDIASLLFKKKCLMG